TWTNGRWGRVALSRGCRVAEADGNSRRQGAGWHGFLNVDGEAGASIHRRGEWITFTSRCLVRRRAQRHTGRVRRGSISSRRGERSKTSSQEHSAQTGYTEAR